jgi:hypothetical protein
LAAAADPRVEADDPAQFTVSHSPQPDLSCHGACVAYALATSGYERAMFRHLLGTAVAHANDSHLFRRRQVVGSDGIEAV